jgi:pilus assembly protein CpaF
VLSITITDKDGRTQKKVFDKGEVTIGRVRGNDLVVAKGNISKKHARIVERDGQVVVLDLRSTNGTFVNGKRITSPAIVSYSDEIKVGDTVIRLVDSEVLQDDDADFVKEHDFEEIDHSGLLDATSTEVPPIKKRKPAPPPKKAKKRSSDSKYVELLREVHQRLIDFMDLRRVSVDKLGDEELWEQTEAAIRKIVVQMESENGIADWVDVEVLIKDVLNEALGLGPLEDFLANPEVTEIMVNHAKQVFIEREGKLQLADKTFSSDQAVIGVIERIVAPIGRRIDESSPMVDARLQDGSRVNAIIPPLALKGPSITIRKFKKEAMSADDLIGFNTFTGHMAKFMEMCVKSRKNVIVSGGTGSGKTTTLNCLSAFIPQNERIITVEDAAELQIKQDHWIQLESRPPNIEGSGEITIRDLVKNCLRMRPDRIIVGECRSGEALDMLQAMNTGHDGSLTTVHANTPRDALARLETMVLMAGMDLPVRAIREQVASAVDIIIQQTRFSDGTRRITHVTEVTGMEGDIITLQDIFYFKQEGFDEDGRVMGRFLAKGFIPRFYDDLQKRGIPVDMSIFHEE